MSWINVETDEDGFWVNYGLGDAQFLKDGLSYTWYRGTDVNFNPDQILLLEPGSAIESIFTRRKRQTSWAGFQLARVNTRKKEA